MGLVDRVRAAMRVLSASGETTVTPVALPALPPAGQKQLVTEAQGATTGLASAATGTGTRDRRTHPETFKANRDVPILRRVVGKIGDSIGAVRWQMFAISKQAEARRAVDALKSMPVDGFDDLVERRKALKRLQNDDSLREIPNHPYIQLLDDPNPDHTGPAFRALTQNYLDLVGNSFWWLPSDEGARSSVPTEILPIPSTWVHKRPTPDDPFWELRHRDWQQIVPADDVVWFRHLDPANPYGDGWGMAQSLADELDGYEWASKHLASFFTNRAIPDLLISVPDATEDQLKVMRLDLERALRGAQRAHRTHFVNDEAKVEKLDTSFKDMTVNELREAYADTVRQSYGVPPELLGKTEDSNRATSMVARLFFAIGVLVPRLEFLRVEQQERVIPRYPQSDRLLLWYDDPIPEDTEFTLKAMEAQPATVRANEWRDMQGLDPLEGEAGDAYMIPSGVTPRLELVGDDEDEPAPPTNPTRSKQTPDLAALTAAIDSLDPTPLQLDVDPLVEATVLDFGRDVMTELGVDLSFSMVSPLVLEHLREASADRIVGLVHNETRRQLRATLAEGAAAGEAIPALSKRVGAVFAAAKGKRAKVIARTEVLRSSNFARHEGMRQSGIVQERQWLTARDFRVRREPRDSADHVIMDGQIQRMDTPFVVPSGNHVGATAMHPGGFGVAALDIQCRCTTIPVRPANRGVPEVHTRDASPEVRRNLADAIDARRARHEELLEARLRSAFGRQEREVLRMIEALDPRR